MKRKPEIMALVQELQDCLLIFGEGFEAPPDETFEELCANESPDDSDSHLAKVLWYKCEQLKKLLEDQV